MPGDSPQVFERLGSALADAGVTFVHTHHRPVYTSAEAAEVRGAKLHSGAKALILKIKNEFVMAVLPADLSLDSGLTRRLLGSKKMRFATADEVLELTGLTPGSIPPFGSLFNLRTICDARLSENVEINFNAGSHEDSFRMSYESYIAYESPQLADIAKGT